MRLLNVIGGYAQPYFFTRIIEGESNDSTYRLRRGRLKFSGHLVDPAYQFVIEYEFAGTKLMTVFFALQTKQNLFNYCGAIQSAV